MLSFIWVILLILFSIVLIRTADLVVHSLKKISLKLKINTFIVSAILVSLGTCLPEIVVAITSSFDGKSSLSLGNVLGANIANVSLVVGFSGFLLGNVGLRAPSFQKDVKSVILSSFLLALLMFDGKISRFDGAILILAYLIYIVIFISEGEKRKEHFSFGRNIFRPHFAAIEKFDFKLAEELLKLFISLAILLFSAQIMLKSSINLTSFLHFSIFDVGLIFIAIGTTLPEVAFSIRSIKDHEPSMFLGNILGSLITNWTLVVGIAALISPIGIEFPFRYFGVILFFLFVFILFCYFFRTKNKLERWESAVLLSFYFIFLFLQIVND
jgi:cation:H+ antiporter